MYNSKNVSVTVDIFVRKQMEGNTLGVSHKITLGKVKPAEVFSEIGEGTLT